MEQSFDAVIEKTPGVSGSFVVVPLDVKQIFGKVQVPVHASFDGEERDGRIEKRSDGVFVLGIRKDVQTKLNKGPGDEVRVSLRERVPAPETRTVLDYIAEQPAQLQPRLLKLRETILAVSPQITEKVSWGMATFQLDGNLIHFACEKNHTGVHPTPAAIVEFADRLRGYRTSKGSVQFPHAEPVPYDLVQDMVRFNVAQRVAE